jgi:hypothetical protein
VTPSPPTMAIMCTARIQIVAIPKAERGYILNAGIRCGATTALIQTGKARVGLYTTPPDALSIFLN